MGLGTVLKHEYSCLRTVPKKKMDKREIDIYALAYGGQGIGKIDGKVCFVEGALPGEKVRFAVRENKKSFMRGAVLEVLTPSKDRIEPACPYYGECGGCQYQHVNYEKELTLKAQQVSDIMSRIGGIKDFEYGPVLPSSACYGYRASITMHRSKTCYGYFSKDNKTIIEIDKCPLANHAINHKIPELFAISKKQDITVKSDSSGNIHISNHPGDRFYVDNFSGSDITFSPLAFSQANPYIASSMVKWLRESIGQQKDNVLFDLFCGVGLFGILLRDLFDKVIGVDNSSIAIDCAVHTKKSLSAENIKFYCSDANRAFPDFCNKMKKSAGLVILDPPRSGINSTLAEYLACVENVECIYYISCDPATLARDSRIIAQKNKWKLIKLSCFDMFARTKHIETIAVFKRQACLPVGRSKI